MTIKDQWRNYSQVTAGVAILLAPKSKKGFQQPLISKHILEEFKSAIH